MKTATIELPAILVSTITAFEFTDNPLWRVGQGLDHVKIELTYKLPTDQPTSVEQKEKTIISNPKRGKARRRTEPAPSAGEWPRQPLPAEQPTRQQPTRSCKTPKKQPPPPTLRECQPPATPTVTLQPTTIQRPTKPTTPPTTLPPPILKKQPPPQTPAAVKQPPTKQPPTKQHQQPPPKKPTKPPVLNPKKTPLSYYLRKGYKITNIYGERRRGIHHYYCTMQRHNEEPTYIICQNKPLETNILILKIPCKPELPEHQSHHQPTRTIRSNTTRHVRLRNRGSTPTPKPTTSARTVADQNHDFDPRSS